jgi:hypothetical protein
MMLLKADQTTEAGALPSRADLEAMGKVNEEIVEIEQTFMGATRTD